MNNRKNKKKRKANRARLILTFSVFVFIIIGITSSCLFTFYSFVNHSTFIDFATLPRHTNQYLYALISLILGLFLTLLFSKYILRPIYSLYEAIDEISDGNFRIRLNKTGLKLLKTLAEKTNTMAAELESSEAMRNDFINNFSHEFKTPIVSIGGFARILKDEKDLTTEEKQEYLEIIINESERLANLSNDILNLTKLENQSIVSLKENFNISEQIRLVIIVLANRWKEKNIDISFDGDDYMFFGNKSIMQQLWTNLIDNAYKFSEENSEITISAVADKSNLIFTISDGGKGMTEREIKHAFDKFFQGDVSHKSKGNGIGLTIVKKVCELHGGSVIIKKSDESGTTFEITLPRFE